MWSPWVPGIAAGLAVIVVLGGTPRENDQRRERAEEDSLEACAREGRFRFAELDRNLTYQDVPPSRLEQAHEMLPLALEYRQSLEARAIVDGRQPVAAVFVLPVGEGDGREGFIKGFTDRAADFGGRPRKFRLGSAESTVVSPTEGPQRGQLLAVSFVGCRAVVAVAADEETLRVAITPVVGG